MSKGVQTAIAIGPEPFPDWVRDAVCSAGAQVSNYQDATGLIWVSPTDVAGLDAVLRECPHINWVQIPFAGVENFISIINNDRVWTCGKGVYAEPVAEHALGLILAGLRNIGRYAQETSWTRPIGRNLWGHGSPLLAVGNCSCTSAVIATFLVPHHRCASLCDRYGWS